MKPGKRKKKELPGEEPVTPKKMPSKKKPAVEEPEETEDMEKGDDDSTTPDPTQPDTEITHRKRHEIGDDAVKKKKK